MFVVCALSQCPAYILLFQWSTLLTTSLIIVQYIAPLESRSALKKSDGKYLPTLQPKPVSKEYAMDQIESVNSGGGTNRLLKNVRLGNTSSALISSWMYLFGNKRNEKPVAMYTEIRSRRERRRKEEN